MFRSLLACAVALTLVGCTQSAPNADPQAIAAVSYRDAGPAYLTLYTMVNNRTGGGGHSSLMINGSERVIFDPAGSFHADIVPEYNDVLYGITPAVERAYRGAHARSTYHVVRQKVEVTPEQAEIALQLAKQNGQVMGAWCSNATARLLKQVPGFEQIDMVYQPVKLQEQFEQIPGVVTDRYYEDDDEDLQKGLTEGNADLNQQVQG